MKKIRKNLDCFLDKTFLQLLECFTTRKESDCMEISIKNFKKDIAKLNNQKLEGKILEFDEALELIINELSEILRKDLDFEKTEKEEKNKAYLRKKKEQYREYISEIVFKNNIKVRGYLGGENEKTINDFIDEMVEEFVGYSILSDAFNDPEISDIYVIDWKTIFVEKKGKNQKYWRTFRSQEHYKNFLDRILREAGKEINNGDSKIVDFEIYGDRGCATSTAVSPRDYSLTIRKHAEDHITRDQLIKYGVLTEEMANFLGMLIVGECNIIYAGLTGSGKTTSIRALIDYYVTKANKRMIVCEDTQELFPKNEHTLELVSVKSDDKRLAISLQQLVYTALRLKPKYIVVGEVRAEEAQSAVEAMETGHSTIFTMHGGNPWNIVNRLVTKYLMAMPSLSIDVVERIIGSAVDYIAIQDNIPGIGRRITSITEVNYDFNTRRITMKPIWKFDFKENNFVFLNKISPDKAEKMLRRGVTLQELDKWVEGGLL